MVLRDCYVLTLKYAFSDVFPSSTKQRIKCFAPGTHGTVPPVSLELATLIPSSNLLYEPRHAISKCNRLQPPSKLRIRSVA